MKKFKKIALFLVLILAAACLFVACTENTKQDAVETAKTYTAVTSNGGTAVQYGNYLYYVNGYAGSSVLNTFGSVQTGAICRVELKKDAATGELYYDHSTFKIIVPKNVYGTDTTYSGIYIVGDYIYYHTTSVEKNSKREYKTDEGVLARTSLDGGKTEDIKSFSDNATVFYVADNYLVYVYSDNDGNKVITAVKLSDLSETTVESESVVEYKFSENYMIYTTYNTARETGYTSDYLVKLFDFKTGKTTLLLSSDIYNNNSDGYLYTTTIKSIQETADAINLFYIKDDNSTNDINTGYYFCSFAKAAPVYNSNKECRLTYQKDTTYDKFFLLNNGWLLTYHDKVFDIYENSNGVFSRKANDSAKENGAYLTYTLTGATDLIGVYESDTEVYAYFTTSATISDKSHTALNYIKLFNIENGEYTVAEENVAVFFYFNYKSTYTTYEVTDVKFFDGNNVTEAKAVYYLNSDYSDNAFACYHIIQNGNDKKDAEKEAAGKLLGNVEEEKFISFISSGEVTEEE